MRSDLQAAGIQTLFQEIAKRAKGPGRIYVTGGATAILMGWRTTTVDIDIKLFPEPPGVFEAIRELKNQLNVNIELASPDHFIPELPGWESRSIFIDSFKGVEFFHYDLYSQALSKIERGHQRDLADVKAMLNKGLVEKKKLLELFQSIEEKLVRYPRIEPKIFKKRLEDFLG